MLENGCSLILAEKFINVIPTHDIICKSFIGGRKQYVSKHLSVDLFSYVKFVVASSFGYIIKSVSVSNFDFANNLDVFNVCLL